MLVAQVWVYGNSFESQLVAVAVPNKDGLEAWAKSSGAAGQVEGFEELCKSDAAKKYILEQLADTGKKGKVSGEGKEPSCKHRGLALVYQEWDLCNEHVSVTWLRHSRPFSAVLKLPPPTPCPEGDLMFKAPQPWPGTGLDSTRTLLA